MASEFDFLQLVGTAWEWIKQEVGTWARAMGNLKAVLTDLDLESDQTLRFALRFSAFSIMVAILANVPPKFTFVPGSLTLLSALAIFISYYVVTFTFGIFAKVMRSLLDQRSQYGPVSYCLYLQQSIGLYTTSLTISHTALKGFLQ